jgi:hypothetical protein
MAHARFEIEKYQLTLGGDLPTITSSSDEQILAIIGCYGKGGNQLYINFVADGAILPRPLYDESNLSGAIFVPASLLPSYVDMLRNEKPVYGYCNSEQPYWNSISTSPEPIGENER